MFFMFLLIRFWYLSLAFFPFLLFYLFFLLLSTPGKIQWKVIIKRPSALSRQYFHTEKYYQTDYRMAVNILDFAMVIESVHQRSLWKIFRANGILSHLVEIIKSFYDNFTCSVGDGDFLFEVDTGVRNGCVMSTLLFNLVVNWIMRRTTEDQFRSIRWTALLSYMEDLD